MNNEIANLKDVIEYAQRKMQKLQNDWDFEDFAKPLERKQTKENSEKTIDQAKYEIKEMNIKINQLNEQMTKGVPEPVGVN